MRAAYAEAFLDFAKKHGVAATRQLRTKIIYDLDLDV
jgi:hypothetical protein